MSAPEKNTARSLEQGRQAASSSLRREMVGQVVSDKMDKTVVVVVKRLSRHARYGKVLRRITRLKAHDETNQCHVGDHVRLVETRPLSKDKHFRVVQIIQKASTV
jgi:small subunit ribosomal protein S17